MHHRTSLIFLTLAAIALVAVRDGRGEDAAPQPPTQQQVPPTTQPATQGAAPATQEPEVPKPAMTILGKSVRSSAGEDMGRLVDVVVDRDGRPRAAIIDFGGFLGVGSRKIAVDWGVLRFGHDKDKGDLITVELTRDQVKAAPEYKDKQAVIVLGGSGSLQSLTPE